MHTIVASDMHLSEAQTHDPSRPLWMEYKREKYFIDDDFAAFLEHLEAHIDGPIELVLNGDIFDFDSVTQLPEAPPEDRPKARIDWLARLRGLSSEEWMSLFKIRTIVAAHPLWFEALAGFLERGHHVVFVIGNHDIELCWPSVQRVVRDALRKPDEEERLRFCDWFYLSGDDTYISHGHQYDPNCSLKDPIDPLIEVHGRPRVRIPFGDQAGRYLLNGMGYFNPHASQNYIMSALDYGRFFFRYMLRTQPFLVWTWFWGAVATFLITLRDHLRPAMRDPLRVDDKVSEVAARARVTPSVVRKLSALHVPPSCTQPLAVVQELWLDRAFLLFAVLLASWQVVLHVNVAWPISPGWVLVPMALLLPPYLVYASRVKSSVFAKPLLDDRRAALIAQITGASSVVFGHTHEPQQRSIGPVRYVNSGFWSAAFANPECTERIGTQTFTWIRPTPAGPRAAQLHEWVADEKRTRLLEPTTEAEPLPSPSESLRPPALN